MDYYRLFVYKDNSFSIDFIKFSAREKKRRVSIQEVAYLIQPNCRTCGKELFYIRIFKN